MYSVLIIDDEPWARTVVKKLADFEGLGLKVIGEAEDGLQALDAIDERMPDIVITDMRMPGIDGVGLLRRINEKYPNMMIIAMSGYNDFIYLKQAIQSGVIEYLLKPVNPDELNKALKKSISRLEERNSAGIKGSGTLHLFRDEALQERYVELRRSIHEEMIAKNIQQISRLFLEMSSYIKKRSDITDEMASKIRHDFVQLLEEHILALNLDLHQIIKGSQITAIIEEDMASGAEVFELLEVLYNLSFKNITTLMTKGRQLDVNEVKAFLEDNYGEGISLESTAAAFHISKEHLSRTFKRQIGMTVNDCLVKIRMEKAARLLRESNAAIKDIMILCGYTDLAYFYRVFKKYFGVAPGEYRHQP